MARKLRVEYPGALYHVLNRGDRREPIFKDDPDRRHFVETLGECCAKTGWEVHAYTLLANHLKERPKGDPAKLRLAQRLRAETIQTVAWIAERLHLGSRAYAHHLLWRARKEAERQ